MTVRGGSFHLPFPGTELMATKKPVAKAPARKVAAKKAPAVKRAPARRAKQDEVEEAIEAVVGKAPRGKKGAKGEVTFDVAGLYSDTLDDVSRRQDFDSDLLEDVPPMSTGILALDLVEGGGIRPAWYTHFGPEQSCKTTGALHIMAAGINANIPIIGLADYEGSTKNSKPYVANILRTCGAKISIKEVFGKKDAQTGKWTVAPRVRYRAETIGEKFFDWLHDMLQKLPDKKFIAGKWWLVFDETKENKAKLDSHSDKTMSKKYGKGIWIPAPDGALQALILVDSYPAMNPTSNDKEDGDNSLALQARMFSKHLPRVKGRLASKMVAVIGINQLRAVPMAMYGPKEAEPGGQALRFNSDVRIQWTPLASNLPFNPKFDAEDRREHEPSVEVEGTDRYRYVRFKAIKNKLWTPGRMGFVRLWEEDGSGEARGFDPFFDTVYYLRQTGQLTGKNRKNMYIDLKGLGAGKKVISWAQLKEWVLGDKAKMTEHSNRMGYKPMNLRSWCFRQLASGVGEELYVAKRNQKKSKSMDDDAEE
jgi:RecA/RadA recombinase